MGPLVRSKSLVRFNWRRRDCGDSRTQHQKFLSETLARRFWSARVIKIKLPVSPSTLPLKCIVGVAVSAAYFDTDVNKLLNRVEFSSPRVDLDLQRWIGVDLNCLDEFFVSGLCVKI